MKNTLIIVAGLVVCFFGCYGIAQATIEYGDGISVPYLKVGSQSAGGVTYFNGTIINETTNDGVDNPVTFGDNVRIDGALQRGHNQEGDVWPVKIDDSLEVYGDISTNGNTVDGIDVAAIPETYLPINSPGLVKAAIHVDADGSIIKSFGDVVSSTRVGSGNYEITFGFDVSESFFQLQEIDVVSGNEIYDQMNCYPQQYDSFDDEVIRVRCVVPDTNYFYFFEHDLSDQTFMLTVY